MRFSNYLGLIAAALMLAPVALGQQGVPAGSFIRRHVSSVAQLIAHIKADPVVKSRYLRHFAMSEPELMDFLRSLRLSKLQATGTYVMYGVPDSGLLRSKAKLLKRGTPVFVDRGGNPALVVICGNPLMRGPKRPFAVAMPVQPIRVPVMPMPMAAEIATTTEPFVTEVAQPTIMPMQPDLVAVTPPVVTEYSSDAPIVNILPALGILPALFVIGNTGGDSPNPVPEPATLLIVTAGIGIFARAARRSRGL